MSIESDEGARPSIRLESWQGQPESSEATSISEKREIWMVAVVRELVAGAPCFEVQFLRFGTKSFQQTVPIAAHKDLAEIFLKGGSFLRASMPHMEREWNLIEDSHPQLYSIYEQECLLSLAPTPSADPVWKRL